MIMETAGPRLKCPCGQHLVIENKVLMCPKCRIPVLAVDWEILPPKKG